MECGECGRGVLVEGIYRAQAELADGTTKHYAVDPPRHHYCCATAKLFARDKDHPQPYSFSGRPLDWAVWRYIVDHCINEPDTIRMQVLARQAALQRQGEDVDGDIAHARRKLAEVDQERAFYQRQAGRGRLTEEEFDARMDETEDARRHWQSELDRLKELRDNTDRVQSGLDCVAELMATYQAKVHDIDQPPDELAALPKEKQREILLERQAIIRALCESDHLVRQARQAGGSHRWQRRCGV